MDRLHRDARNVSRSSRRTSTTTRRSSAPTCVERIRGAGGAAPWVPRPAHQRDRLRRWRGRAPRHARPAAAQRRHRRRLAGDPGQRRVLRHHEGGPQRAAGRRRRLVEPQCSASTSSRCSTTLSASKASGTSSWSHDPQPAAFRSFLRDSELGSARDEVDLALPHRPHRRRTRRCGSSSGRTSSMHDASVWTMQEFVPDSLSMDRVVEAPPCIDPLSVKNLELPHPVRRGAVPPIRARRASPDRLPGEPVRPVEGPRRRHRGVSHRAREGHRRAAAARRLDGHRRPRGLPASGRRYRRRGPAIPTSTCSRTSIRSATCRSTRSSASPTSSSRSRCGRASGSPSARRSGRADPSSAGAPAASCSRSATASTATSSTRSTTCAARTIDLLADPVGADAMGTQGKEHVRGELPRDPRARGLAPAARRNSAT